jgi:hypothetical protein
MFMSEVQRLLIMLALSIAAQGVPWLLHGAEAVPSLFGITNTFDKVELGARDGDHDFGKAKVVAVHPRLGILDGLFVFLFVTEVANGQEVPVVVHAMESLQ